MIFLLLLICALWVGTAAAITVQAVADRDRIALGESLQLQLRLDGSPDAEPDFGPLQQDWEILGRSQSSQMQIINGSFNRSIVYSLTLMPRGQGNLTIPAICFDRDCSLPLPIEVATQSSPGSSVSEQLLLESEISPQEIVTQGQLLLKVRLLRRVDLLEGQLSEPQPGGVEALVKKLGDDRSYELRRNGQLYQVIERVYAIFPQGSGQMSIPALRFDGTIAGGSSRSYPFGRQGQRVRRTSQPLQVEVTPLPSDLGRRPWIPATRVELQDDWQQRLPRFVVGEPVTRTLRLSADGVISAQLPELTPDVPAGFKTYPDQPTREDKLLGSGIRGVVEQKIALVPTQAGAYRLPAVELDWWDLTSSQWRRVHLAALEIDVAPAVGDGGRQPALISPPPPGEPAMAESEPSTSAPVADSGAAVDYSSPGGQPGIWPWVSLALAIGWLLTLVLFFARRTGSAPATLDTTAAVQLKEKAARRAVVQAARGNDPQSTRKALLDWSRIVWPAAQSEGYRQLCEVAEQDLLEELQALDSCLYGRTNSVWDGQGLAAKFTAWRPVLSESATPGLPALYPEKS
jgi:hypothetical protein